jgi:hypothetical protein
MWLLMKPMPPTELHQVHPSGCRSTTHRATFSHHQNSLQPLPFTKPADPLYPPPPSLRYTNENLSRHTKSSCNVPSLPCQSAGRPRRRLRRRHVDTDDTMTPHQQTTLAPQYPVSLQSFMCHVSHYIVLMISFDHLNSNVSGL